MPRKIESILRERVKQEIRLPVKRNGQSVKNQDGSQKYYNPKGLPLRRLAQEIDVALPTLWNWLNGKRNLGLEVAQKLADRYGLQLQ